MNDAELQKIRDSLSSPDSPLYGSDLVPLIIDLIEENEFLCSQAPCPKCGYGITGACYGCGIKRLKEELAKLQAQLAERGRLITSISEVREDLQLKIIRLEAQFDGKNKETERLKKKWAELQSRN